MTKKSEAVDAVVVDGVESLTEDQVNELLGATAGDELIVTEKFEDAGRLFDGVAADEQIERDNGLFMPAGQSDGDTMIIEGGAPASHYEALMDRVRENHAATVEPTHAEKTAALIARIEAHEAEQVEIEKVTRELGHDVKSIRTIRRARDKAEKAKRTLDALYGAGLVKEGQV